MEFDRIVSAFEKAYGPGTGRVKCMTVLPGVMGDFLRMTASAAPGRRVREEYRLDDGRGTLILEGPGGAGPEDISVEFAPA